MVKKYVNSILYMIFFSNAIINPLVYGWMSPDYNYAFKQLLRLGEKEKARALSMRQAGMAASKISTVTVKKK